MSPVIDATLSDAEVMRAAMGEFRAAASELVARLQFARAMGLTYDGTRNLALAYGYKDQLTVADYRIRYERGGLAGRVVDAIAKATWRGGCELIEDEDPKVDTEFEQQWASLDDRLHIVAELQTADILSRISGWSALLLGDGGDVTQPLERGSKGPDGILYVASYCGSGQPAGTARQTFASAFEGAMQADAMIDALETNPADPRFGLPKTYRFRRTDFKTDEFSQRPVHWTRVVHLAEDGLDNKIYGRPALQRSWNNFDDLDKLVGGGCEAFFQRANQGRVWSIDKDIKLDVGEKEDFRKQIEELQHNIVRDVRGRGLTVDTLSSDVANFANQFDAVVTAIAGANGIPKRILTGSEMGELASSQDRDNWRDQVNGRRENYADPFVVRRLVDRLIEFGFLVKPAQYKPRWGAVLNMTEDEKKAKALSWAQTNAANKSPVFLGAEIRGECYEMAPLTPEQLRTEIAVQTSAQPTAPQPAAGGAFPRAAEDLDGELVERLAAAIEDEDGEAILEILGDVPGHEFHGNQWTTEGATLKDTHKRIDALLGGRGARKKTSVAMLGSLSKEKLQQLHQAYAHGASIATGLDKLSFVATKSAIEAFLNG